jgi:uncharacterized membrane protein (DUF4010 family)
MSYLRGFVPWIVFGVLSTVDRRWAAVAALVLGVLLLLRDRLAGVAADAQILDVSTVVYFTSLANLAFAVPHSPLRHYDGALLRRTRLYSRAPLLRDLAWYMAASASLSNRSPSRSP